MGSCDSPEEERYLGATFEQVDQLRDTSSQMDNMLKRIVEPDQSLDDEQRQFILDTIHIAILQSQEKAELLLALEPPANLSALHENMELAATDMILKGEELARGIVLYDGVTVEPSGIYTELARLYVEEATLIRIQLCGV